MIKYDAQPTIENDKVIPIVHSLNRFIWSGENAKWIPKGGKISHPTFYLDSANNGVRRFTSRKARGIECINLTPYACF